ncbi:uncharacterized protein LOC134812244 [Bolinopsis microptera]|uniref:uncharacterized protein LOC134812244 n=1 Tax=Bolinopsis microptera TaxID=2820187 RepID=UPI003079CC9C
MEWQVTSAPSKEHCSNFNDDLTFRVELFSDILNPPLANQLGRIECALNVLSRNNKMSVKTISKKTKKNHNHHCNLCEENSIYKVPLNCEVKFTQFSKLTFKDMEDALFLRESAKYQSHNKLMKLVNSEQDLFENFLGSLNNKFSMVKSKIPSPWYQHAHQKFDQAVMKEYGNCANNFRLLSTHVLNVSVISIASPSIEIYGQLLAYGNIFKIKLPKLGQLIKTDLSVLHRPRHKSKKTPSDGTTHEITRAVPCREQSPTPSGIVTNITENASIDQIVLQNGDVSNTQKVQDSESSDKNLLHSLSSESSPNDSTLGNEKERDSVESANRPVINCLNDSLDMEISDIPSSEPMLEMENTISDDSKTENVLTASDLPASDSTSVLVQNSDEASNTNADGNDAADTGNSETNSSPSSVVYKHVKVAISQDLDVFITDVPVNDLNGKDQKTLTHDHVKEFLLGLKVAECIADIDSLCHVFSVSPPDFVQSFLFKIDVVVQEDKSKYFKISEPLPHGKVTAESVKQDIMSDILINSCRNIDIGHEGDANTAFMQYLDDCGTQLIDKANSNSDVKTQLQDFVEPLKFTSYLPWRNLNSKSLDNVLYSLFSVSDTNVIVHSKQPFMVNFEDSFEKAVILVKPQYCYEYGLEDITHSEYAALYLKTLLLECVGAIVFHVDMKTFNIVHVDKLYLEELSDLFPRAEAIGRLTSFFGLLHTLREGIHVYSHDINQAHGVLYEELQSEHIQADLVLDKDVSMELCKIVRPVRLSRTKLTSWQRHNVRLPMCFLPRKNGTYLCHEYLSKETCSKTGTCAFAHLNKAQLECELGAVEYARFMENFLKPKGDKQINQNEMNKKNPNFGKILHKKHRHRKKGGPSQKKKS